MNIEQIQIALFDAFDIRATLANSVKKQKMDNGETIGATLDALIEFLESLEAVLSMPDYRSDYRRALYYLLLDYETMIYAILATLLRLLKK